MNSVNKTTTNMLAPVIIGDHVDHCPILSERLSALLIIYVSLRLRSDCREHRQKCDRVEIPVWRNSVTIVC